MVKKAKVFKPGDYVFAKVKGYPAWPAKVVAINGKKYNIYFFGTGETGNLPPNDLFDYLENKKTFTAKVIKRKDYNAGLEQIEAEIGGLGTPQEAEEEEDNGAPPVDDSTVEETADEQNNQNNTAESEKLEDGDKSSEEPPVEKSKEDVETEKPIEDKNAEEVVDDASKTADEVPEAEAPPAAIEPALEEPTASAEAEESPAPSTGRAKRTSVVKKPPTTPAPVKTPRRSLKQEPITPKVEPKTPVVNPETISRSGRKIKPKRYMDMEALDSSPEGTKAKRPKLLSPGSMEEPTAMETEESEQAAAAIPIPDSETVATPLPGDITKEGGNSTAKKKGKKAKEGKELNGDTRKLEERFNLVNASELEDIKEQFKSKTLEENTPPKESILLCLLPTGKFIGIKLFQDRPESFGTPTAKQIWENNTAKNSLRLKRQLESGETKPETIPTQLETDLQLTEDELVTLRKERELDIQRNRLSFFRTENKLLDLELRIQGALSFNSPDVQSCIQMLTQIAELEVKQVMLLKHPSLVETVKRIRRYVGNPAQWKLSEKETVEFEQKAHLIRKKGHHCYNQFKALFTPDEGKSFFEHFSDLVLRFKKCTQGLTELELLELDEEPSGFWTPDFLTMKVAADKLAGESTEKASQESSKNPEAANSSKKDKVI